MTTFKKDLYGLIARQPEETAMQVLHDLQEAVCCILYDISPDKLQLKAELDKNVNTIWLAVAEKYKKHENS